MEQGRTMRMDKRNEEEIRREAVFLSPTASAAAMVGTRTVAKAMLRASTMLVMLSALKNRPESRAAYFSSASCVGMPSCPGMPEAKALEMPREMVAVSMTRATEVMMELREMGMESDRILRIRPRRSPLSGRDAGVAGLRRR